MFVATSAAVRPFTVLRRGDARHHLPDAAAPRRSRSAPARSAQGFRRRAVRRHRPVTDGTTKEQIQSFIRSRLNAAASCGRPSSCCSATPRRSRRGSCRARRAATSAECNIASDLPYSLDGHRPDLFADVMLGRIPAHRPRPTRDAVVNKILTYQNTPPAPDGRRLLPPRDGHRLLPAGAHLRAQRGRDRDAELRCRGRRVTGHWEIDFANQTRHARVHEDHRRDPEGDEPAVLHRRPAVDDRRRRRRSRVLLRRHADPGRTATARVRRGTRTRPTSSTRTTQGRFLILHRDHGWPDGWAEPTLHSGHVPQLTNGTKLPVVFGINCSSAAFDDPVAPELRRAADHDASTAAPSPASATRA